jgi:hypothetical protein
MNKIQEAIDNLESVLREHCATNVVTFNVFINCEGRRVTISERGADELKSAGISMRNLAGKFIS